MPHLFLTGSEDQPFHNNKYKHTELKQPHAFTERQRNHAWTAHIQVRWIINWPLINMVESVSYKLQHKMSQLLILHVLI
jgi:hypothetical protein